MPLTIDQQLASADAFAILASSTVTNSGATVITGGNLGLYPGTSVTGFPPGVVVPPAVQHITDQVANQAEIDAMTAWNVYKNLAPGTVISELAGQVLTPGTYTAASTLDLSVGGVLTLSGNGNFIFQVGSALTINVGASILLTNGALAKNVVWQVGSSATVNTSAVMVGDIIALASVSLGTGASLAGRAIALTGAVTLLGNAITVPASVTPPFPIVISSVPATIGLGNLSELCFPDITGRVIRAWGLVTITPGGYTVGGIPFGLFPFLDVRTVDVNAFLKCDVYGEEPYGAVVVPGIDYHYSPTNDALQIFYQGVEFIANQTIPAAVLSDVLLFECWVDRTSTRDAVPFSI
jgi:hypothetical protein